MSDRRKNAVLLLMLMMTAGMTFPASAKVTQTEVTATSESKTSDEPVVKQSHFMKQNLFRILLLLVMKAICRLRTGWMRRIGSF